MSKGTTKILTITELKRRLKELPREEVVGLLVNTIKMNKYMVVSFTSTHTPTTPTGPIC